VILAQALDLEEATTAVKALHAVICTRGPSGPQGGIGGNLQRCEPASEQAMEEGEWGREGNVRE
jgi:hypothetical protein